MTRNASLSCLAGIAVVWMCILSSQPAMGEVIAHWSFDTDFSDSSGNGNDGTAKNGASTSTAESKFGGSALYLDAYNTEGTNNQQHVQVPNPQIQTSSFTIAAWVRPETLERDWTDIFGYWKRNDTIGDNYPFAFHLGQDNKVYVRMRPDFDGVGTSNTYTLLNTWNHVAVTFDRDAKEMRIYVNGEQAGYRSTTGDVDMQGSVSDWTIGRKDDSGTPYDGYIDELWVFNEALSADQVDQLMELNVVPEPSTVTLLLLGSLVGLFAYRRKRMKTHLFLAFVSMFLVASVARAESIGLNVGIQMGTEAVAGPTGLRQANWNDAVVTIVDDEIQWTSVIDDGGNAIATTAVLSFTKTNGDYGTIHDTLNSSGVNDNRMFSSYVDLFGGSSVDPNAILTVSNIAYAQYDVYVYLQPDDPDRVAGTEIGGRIEYMRKLADGAEPTDGDGYIESNHTTAPIDNADALNIPQAHFVKFEGLTDSTLTAKFWGDLANDNTQRFRISGIQIQQVPEPATFTLTLLGVLGLALWRWQRRRNEIGK